MYNEVTMSDLSAAKQIDKIIQEYGGWKGDTINRLRIVVKGADPGITEEIKWKMATRPEGLPVWVHGGIVCYIETWKDNIKLIFHKGSHLHDTNELFNARLKSSTIRAIELHEGGPIDEQGIHDLVIQAMKLNDMKRSR
jgi:hypothetical protein